MGILALVCGCTKPMHFPQQSIPSAASAAGASAAYDTNRDGQADFFTFADESGRITRLGFGASPAGGAEQMVNLAELDFSGQRHLVIILDGLGYDVVKDYYDSGGLRLFHPPSRIIAPYPTLTDLALEDILGYIPCKSFEAEYYDRHRGKVVGGSFAYLAGANQPYNRILDYRAHLIWDPVGYLAPKAVFGKEVNDLVRVLDRNDRLEVIGYLVSSAGVSTIWGAEGQLWALKLIDRLTHQAVWSSRGLTQVTLLADHGHSYTPAKRAPLEKYLQTKGWHVSDNYARGPRDVAMVRFGVETYASFGCRRPAVLAADLANCPGVTVVSYVEGDSVVVLAGSERAVIRKKTGRYSYDATGGDPLKLKDALSGLKADPEGFYADHDVFSATADQEYPDPLERLWRAHFSLAQHTPDVIISLADEYYSGSKGFDVFVKVASTHGGLNRKNSTTFIMSTAGPLPPLLRSSDIPAAMTSLLGRPWPAKKP